MTRHIENYPFIKKDTNNTPIQNSAADMAFQGDYTGTNLIYRGYARPGSPTSSAVWQIAKLTYSSSNVTAIQWPQTTQGNASTDYEFIWDNRASLTYS